MNGTTASKSLPAHGAAAARAGHVTFLIHLHVKPGREEEFLSLLTPVLDAMRHETTFVNAALHRDPEEPSRLLLYETWTDLDDVTNVQMHRAYRKDYWARLPDLLSRPREIQVWQPLRADFTCLAA